VCRWITKGLTGIHRLASSGSVGADNDRANRTSRGPAVVATTARLRIRSSSVVTDRDGRHRRQLVGEAHLPGDAAQLLVGVQVVLVEDDAQHRLR